MNINSVLEGASGRVFQPKFLVPTPSCRGRTPRPLYIGQMICFCAERFHLAADMAESGRTLAPRTSRHGHSRASLSAALRTFPPSGQARLANLFGPAAPASARAALHPADPSERPRSDPDHAAARHHRRRQGLCAASRRLDRRASWPVAEGGAVSSGHRGPAARRRAPNRASRGQRGTVWTEIRDSGERILCVAGGAEYIERRVHDYLKREARKDVQKASPAYAQALGVKVKRLSIRDQSSRWGSCTSAGSLSFSWRLILAPPYVLDYLAAHEVAHLVEMNHSARFWRVVAKGLRPCRARQELARHPRQRSPSLRHRGLSGAGVHFPMLERHRSTHVDELRKVTRPGKRIESGTAYRDEVPDRTRRLAAAARWRHRRIQRKSNTDRYSRAITAACLGTALDHLHPYPELRK